MFSQRIGSYEGDGPLQGRFGSGHPGHVELGIKEAQLAGGHFGRVAGVKRVLQGAGAILGPQTKLEKREKELEKQKTILSAINATARDESYGN